MDAVYGGVYVEKKAGMSADPFLADTDIITRDDPLSTKKNWAVTTREISAYAEQEGLFRFHISSLNSLKPDNVPDEFEAGALHRFQQGEKETFQSELQQSKTFFKVYGTAFR